MGGKILPAKGRWLLPRLMKHSEIYDKAPVLQVYPTRRGWTVRAFSQEPKWLERRWVNLKEVPVADHRFAEVERAMREALEWIVSESAR